MQVMSLFLGLVWHSRHSCLLTLSVHNSLTLGKGRKGGKAISKLLTKIVLFGFTNMDFFKEENLYYLYTAKGGESLEQIDRKSVV